MRKGEFRVPNSEFDMTIDHSKFNEDLAVGFDKETNDQARVASAIGYFFFFVPIIMHPESKFARYHCNQGLILLMIEFLGIAGLAEIPKVGGALSLLCLVFCLFCLIRGIILALKGQAKRIPFFGKLVIVEFDHMYSFDL